MTEKVLNKNGNGMKMLLLLILGIAGGFGGGAYLLAGSAYFGFLAIPGVLLFLLAPVCLLCLTGLHVLKPQEALVLTLFGKYVGTLKGEGFYWVNPFALQSIPRQAPY